MDREFILERIAATKLQIVAYEEALLQLSNGVTSYTINTSQTQQTVSRSNISDINKTLDTLANRLATYNARLKGSGVIRVNPL